VSLRPQLAFLRRIDHPVIARLLPVRWLLGRLYGLWCSAVYRLRLASEISARTIRLRLVAAGLPLKREFLVLHCMAGNNASGFFSEFAAVVGALEHYENWRTHYAGLHVCFGEQGLYHDSRYGGNWWEYFFEPIDVGTRLDAVTRVISPHQHDRFANRVEQEMPRRTGASLLQRHIRPTPRIQAMVETYVRTNFEGSFVVGVHYRGTDKHEDAPRVPYDEVRAAIREVLLAAKTARYRIFLATDEQAFLNYMLDEFPDTLLYRQMFRSVDGRPIDVTNDDGNYKKGEDAVMDCLLLSRSQFLIRTASNLSLCSTLFRFDLPEILLNPPYELRQAKEHAHP
jgi:hypothetical protein